MPKYKQKVNKVRYTNRGSLRNKDGDQVMLNLCRFPVNTRFLTLSIKLKKTSLLVVLKTRKRDIYIRHNDKYNNYEKKKVCYFVNDSCNDTHQK